MQNVCLLLVSSLISFSTFFFFFVILSAQVFDPLVKFILMYFNFSWCYCKWNCLSGPPAPCPMSANLCLVSMQILGPVRFLPFSQEILCFYCHHPEVKDLYQPSGSTNFFILQQQLSSFFFAWQQDLGGCLTLYVWLTWRGALCHHISYFTLFFMFYQWRPVWESMQVPVRPCVGSSQWV